jgi:hypothetical protein
MEAIGELYDRHAEALLAYFAPCTFDPGEADELTAETFAAALVTRRQLDELAARQLAHYRRTGRVGDRMRRALQLERNPSREELVAAALREERRGRLARVARRVRPRVWVAALAGIVAVVVIGLCVEGPAAPEIVRTAFVGGQPRDAVAVDGRLVVADDDGSVAAIAPDRPERRSDVRVGGNPLSVARAGAAVWVVVQRPTIPPGTRVVDRAGPALTHLLKFDPRSGRVLDRVPVRDVGDALRAGAVGVRLPAYLGRISRLGGAPPPSAHIPVRFDEELVLGERSIWVRRGGAVYEFDAAGRLVARVDGIEPPLSLSGRRSMLPDAGGTWVVGETAGRLYRVERGRVTRRIRVGESAAVVVRGGGTLWVGASSGPGAFELVGVDRERGEVTSRVPLGRSAPEAIVPAGERVWVMTSGGEALLVSPG